MIPMSRLLPITVAACLVLSSSGVHAQGLTDHPQVVEAMHLLDVWIDAQRDYNEWPGVAVGVVHDQDLVFSRGYGYADLAAQTPTTPSTMHSICSISKLFTSIGAMQLRDAGRFRLDDEVSSLLPWFTLQQQYENSAPITVEGLLTHSAGLPRESDYPYWARPFDFPTHDEIVTRVSDQETLYPAWTYFQYSNLGLTLVGEIVAELSGQPYADYMRRQVIEPLSLTSTVPEIGEVWDEPAMATGYSARQRSGDRVRVERFAGNGIAPAMAFASTVEDLGRFASWQFRLLSQGSDEILAANTLREMHRVHWVDPSWEVTWGLGFNVARINDKTFVRHGGSCPGFRSDFMMQTDEQVAAIAMINASGTDPGLVTRRAYEIMAPALKAAQDSTDEGKVLPADWERYVGFYDEYPWGGETAVIPWEGSLALVSLPTDDPLGTLVKLEHEEGQRFRRVRDDDTPGEPIVFETDDAGNVVRMVRHSNPMERVPDRR